MRRVVFIFLSSLILSPLLAEPETLKGPQETQSQTPFQPFTGKIVRNKVRLRLQPSLDGQILKEMEKDALVVVLGETEEFYAVKPPTDIKLYVFRTFVLDGVIEGNHVNVRLEPNVDAAVLAQLNSGDPIEGEISPLNSKWFEITPPEKVRFYIAKDYVDRVGDAEMMATLEKRRAKANELLTQAYKLEEAEFQKPFPSINIEKVENLLTQITKEYGDFSNQAARAKELLTSIHEAYLQKKLAYLEGNHQANEGDFERHSPVNEEISTKVSPSSESQLSQAPTQTWITQENNLYLAWKEKKGDVSASIDDFYEDERGDEIILRGIVEAYPRIIKNKPGDYILISQATGQPIAYLYSTKHDLSGKTKQVLTMRVAPRPNYNFAFPAYFVLDLE